MKSFVTPRIGAALVLCSPLAAQPVPAAPTPAHVSLSELLGSKVAVTDTAPESPPKRGDDRRHRRGQGDDAPEPTSVASREWTLVDLLFVRGDDAIQGVVLEGEPTRQDERRGAKVAHPTPTDVRTVAVPAVAVSLQAAPRLDLPANTFNALHPFDATASDASSLAERLARAQTEWARLGLRTSDPGDSSSNPKASSAIEVVRISQVLDRMVYALDAPFGRIERVVLDWNQRKLAFALVAARESAGATTRRYLVPWSALAWSERAGELHAAMSVTSKQIEDGGVACDDGSDLVDAETARRAQELFRAKVP